MPFAQVHYPFENRDWFESHYPGDFIVEYIGQTRGWFYTLHVLATALFDKPSFRTCLTHGIVLGDDGLKMSKSKGNFPDVRMVFERDGADAMRWFLMSGAILRGGNLVVTDEAIRDAVRQVLLPLWNTWSFFGLYANAAAGGEGLRARRVEASDWATPVGDGGLAPLDRYILARARRLVEDVTAQLDCCQIPEACESIREFLDALNNWYVRESRDRFWGEDAAAFNVLWTVLETLTRLAAPLLPMLSEEIWRGLTGGRSVHLCDWPSLERGSADAAALGTVESGRPAPSLSEFRWENMQSNLLEWEGLPEALAQELDSEKFPSNMPISAAVNLSGAETLAQYWLANFDELKRSEMAWKLYLDFAERQQAEADTLVEVVERVREVCSAALSMRKTHGVKVRQPLRRLVVADLDVARLTPFADLIKSEVNVKALDLVEYSAEAARDHGVYTKLEVNARVAGPRLGRAVQGVIKAVKLGGWRRDGAGGVVVAAEDGEVALLESEYTTRTVVEDAVGDELGAQVLSGSGFALLDLKLNDELLAEGYARDMVRLVQDQRKASGLHVADRIELSLAVPRRWVGAVRAHQELIARETLAVSVQVEPAPTDAPAAQVARVPQAP
jgi:isoleucyl-tRNA synthetase